ncbi:MAG TPA: transglutaminase domain-containing protein [Clostridia bacterium]|nr:transglutaminase domain-containing protein [Clostridia bacterium]
MRKFRCFLILFMLVSLLSPLDIQSDSSTITQPALSTPDLDSDGDGLQDFQEKYKYYTNPDNADSDGDGIPDGDWNERKEYTYTLKANLQITGPWDINSMNNDYQDTRIIAEKKDYMECEIVFYTENTVKDGIGRNDSWGDYGPEFDKYLKPYLYANWDEQMRKDLINELKGLGIDPEKLSDKELVQRVSMWIEDSTESIEHDRPPHFYLRYDEKGNFYVEERFRDLYEEKVKKDKSITLDELVNKLVLGKQMYYNKARGACTSSTTYSATIYRTLGIPTRHLCTTKIRISDDLMYKVRNIKNPLVKEILVSTGETSSNHMYNEVYIDGRWIRIDYDELGAGNIETGRGLYYQHYNPNDLSELRMVDDYGEMVSAPGWGLFNNGEFFNLLDISDSYGKYYKPHYGYRIEPDVFKRYYLFGEKGIYSKVKPVVFAELEKYRKLEKASEKSGNISQFKEEYLKDNNILIISANTEYNKLADVIKAKISKDEYEGLGIDEYKTIEIDKAVVLIVKL